MTPFSYLLITRRLSSEFYHYYLILILFKFTHFSLTLLSKRSYLIWFHDPDFFLPSINPDIIPQAHIRIENQPKYIWVYLRPVYYETLSKSGEIEQAPTGHGSDWMLFKCLLVRLLACLPASLLVSLPAACLLVCLFACILACLFSSLLALSWALSCPRTPPGLFRMLQKLI